MLGIDQHPVIATTGKLFGDRRTAKGIPESQLVLPARERHLEQVLRGFHGLVLSEVSTWTVLPVAAECLTASMMRWFISPSAAETSGASSPRMTAANCRTCRISGSSKSKVSLVSEIGSHQLRLSGFDQTDRLGNDKEPCVPPIR